MISIATIPTRVHFLKPVLEPLLGEGEDIYVWLAGEAKGVKWDGVKPLWVDQLPVNFAVVPDKGPISKLIYALETGEDTIVTIDDDVIFDKGAIRNLVSYSKRTDAVYCYSGKVLKKGVSYCDIKCTENVLDQTPVNMIRGVRGVVYRRNHVEDIKESKHRNVDDIVISAHLYNKRIPIFVVPRHGNIKDHFSHRIDPLYGQNNKKGNQNNDNAINDLYAWK